MKGPAANRSPFAIDTRAERISGRVLLGLARYPLEWLLCLPRLRRIYDEVQDGLTGLSFADRALDGLGITYQVSPEQRRRIPRTGPLVVVANHPFGGLEGLVLTSLLQKVRPDFRILANYFLHRIPELRDVMLFVDPFEGPGAAARNVGAMRQAVRWVESGGVLCVFPSGTVSHFDWRQRSVVDPPWSSTVARIIRRAQAPVLPLFFEGRNPWWFHAAGMVHPRLRTLLLPRVLAKPVYPQVYLHVGKPIAHARLMSLGSDADILAYLRMRTHVLKPTGTRAECRAPLRPARRRSLPQEPLVTEPVDPEACRTEIAALPPEQCVAESGQLQVWFARADRIPRLLEEIGRLREISFRRAGEGTGKAVDLDRFDQTYVHLFVWNTERNELVGAYRLGLTDEIIPRFGVNGLYTSTLFKFARSLIADIQPAIELGRSFVRPEYQRQHSPLALLWRGIGLYVAANPQYKTLFGPVSISNQYQSVSQRVMIAFLQTHLQVREVAELVKPRNPPRWRGFQDLRIATRLLTDINEVSSMVADIESDDKGVPVLLRQYLRLNAKFVCCNRDPDFSGVIDGLMLADLTKADPRILERHMGKEGAARFFAYHRDRSRRAG